MYRLSNSGNRNVCCVLSCVLLLLCVLVICQTNGHEEEPKENIEAQPEKTIHHHHAALPAESSKTQGRFSLTCGMTPPGHTGCQMLILLVVLRVTC